MLFVRLSQPCEAGAANAPPAGTSARAAIAVVAMIAVLARLESVADGYIVFPSVRVSPLAPVRGEPMRSLRAGGSPSSETPRRHARLLRGRAPPVAETRRDGHHFGHRSEPERRGLPRGLPRRAREPDPSSRRGDRRRQRLDGCHGRGRDGRRRAGRRPAGARHLARHRGRDSTRHPATCSPASTPTRCRRPTGWPRSSGGCRSATARRSSPAPACSTAAPAPRRWIARNLYIGGYFTVIGALLGHPPIYGSNYAIRRHAWLELRDVVHRDRADLHDDLDLAWWLQPGMTVCVRPGARRRGLCAPVRQLPRDRRDACGWPSTRSASNGARGRRSSGARPGASNGTSCRRRCSPRPPTCRRRRRRGARDRLTAVRSARRLRRRAGRPEERQHVADELVRRRLAWAVPRGIHREARADAAARTARAARAARGRARRPRRASARARPRARRAGRASRIMSPMMSSTLSRRVRANRSRTNASRRGGTRLRLLRMPQSMSAAPWRGDVSPLIGPMRLTPRNACPGSGGALSSVRLANRSGRSSRASSASVPAKL